MAFDISIGGAFFAGLLSFLSPCILPIVPFYLSYLAGTSINELSSGGDIDPQIRKKAFISSLFFAAGIILVFVGLGATATMFGQLVREYFDVLRWAAAAIIILMGLHFLGILRIGLLYRQLRLDTEMPKKLSYAGSFVIGLAFAFGWTPCVGPVLAAILFTAAGQEAAQEGAMLLFFYGLGMTLPFVIAALFTKNFLNWAQKFRKHLGLVEKLMGLFLIVFGILIATNSVSIIAQWMLEHIPWFSAIG
ncbi:MAG: cytochrome c biogenesis protein CcdA [Rhizobiaceae bacterium]|nr:cytochrome c biogenesis protein CcdA [Rhizobiaceae bacterium]